MADEKAKFKTMGFWVTWIPKLLAVVLGGLFASGGITDPETLRWLALLGVVLPSAASVIPQKAKSLVAPVPEPKQ